MSSKDWVDEMIVMIMTKLKEKILWLKKSEEIQYIIKKMKGKAAKFSETF